MDINRRLVPLGAVVGLLVLGGAPAGALGATRYAAAGSTDTSGSCATPATACQLGHAVDDAANGDDVIVEAGSYTGSAVPSSGLNVPANVTVQGDPSEPIPTISANNSSTSELIYVQSGATVRRLILNELGASGSGVYASGENITLDGLQVTTSAGGDDYPVFVAGPGNRVLDTLAHSTGFGRAVDFEDGSGDVRNVTAVSDNGVGLLAYDSNGTPITVTVKNTIARGHIEDVYADSVSGTATVQMSYSNYKTTFGASILDDGHNQTGPDPSPVFVDQAGGNFHEALGADTIDAGTTDPLDGSADPDGNPRSLGAAPDIGAFEFVPAPSVSTGAVSGLRSTSATLTGSVNPEGTETSASFQLGTSPGGLSRSVRVAAPPGSGSSPVGVSSEPVTGLAPRTTYYYRLVASNPGGTVQGLERSFTTPALPGPGLSRVGELHRRWREGGRRGRRLPPIGTAFTFALSAGARVKLAFTQGATGRKVRGRCVARSRRNRRNRRCGLTLTRGTLTLNGHAGSNRISFRGRVGSRKLKPGTYTLVLTASNPGGTSAAKRLTFTIVR